MVQKLFTELRTLYSLNWGKCNAIRIRVRMRDLVDPDLLRKAVDVTMNRYPERDDRVRIRKFVPQALCEGHKAGGRV